MKTPQLINSKILKIVIFLAYLGMFFSRKTLRKIDPVPGAPFKLTQIHFWVWIEIVQKYPARYLCMWADSDSDTEFKYYD